MWKSKLTKDADKAICLIYKEYLARRDNLCRLKHFCAKWVSITL